MTARAAPGATLAVLATVLWPAAGPALAAVEIWSRQDEFVRVESRDSGEAPVSEHPVQLAPERLAVLLGSLQVRITPDTAPVPVFSRQEIEVLARALSEGLARAEPRQDVSFATIGTRKEGRTVGRRLVNTGRVFHADGRLHLVLGEVHGEHRKRNVYGQRDQDLRPRRVASRTAPEPPVWRIEEQPGVQRHRQAGRERADWLSIDMAVFAAGAASTAGESRAATPEDAGATPASRSASIEERLAALKALFEQGLIPDEIYRARVEAILDEL